MCSQWFPPTRYVKRGIPVRHAHTNVTTFTYFDQNWSIGCLLALYGSTKHPAQLCGGFGQIFFCLEYSGLLDKKKKLIRPN